MVKLRNEFETSDADGVVCFDRRVLVLSREEGEERMERELVVIVRSHTEVLWVGRRGRRVATT